MTAWTRYHVIRTAPNVSERLIRAYDTLDEAKKAVEGIVRVHTADYSLSKGLPTPRHEPFISAHSLIAIVWDGDALLTYEIEEQTIDADDEE